MRSCHLLTGVLSVSLSGWLGLALPLLQTSTTFPPGLLQTPTTFPPGPPQILAGEEEFRQMEMYDDSSDSDFLEDLRRREKISVEIEAFVSRSPTEDVLVSETNVTRDSDYDLIKDLLEVDDTPPLPELGLVLTWWQWVVVVVAGLLVTCLCCYLTSCCYLREGSI